MTYSWSEWPLVLLPCSIQLFTRTKSLKLYGAENHIFPVHYIQMSPSQVSKIHCCTDFNFEIHIHLIDCLSLNFEMTKFVYFFMLLVFQKCLGILHKTWNTKLYVTSPTAVDLDLGEQYTEGEDFLPTSTCTDRW